MNQINRSNISESYYKPPRVNSTHDRHTYDALIELSSLIDFNHPVFNGRSLRNRSLGSVQTVLVELALENEDILNQLKKYMIESGKDWTPILYYAKKYK